MAFSGGEFTEAQRHWATYEKEAYAIVQFHCQDGFSILGIPTSAHLYRISELFYDLAPFALLPNSPRHVLFKCHSGAIHLSLYEILDNHIEGNKNVFANNLTKWSKEDRETTVQRVVALCTIWSYSSFNQGNNKGNDRGDCKRANQTWNPCWIWMERGWI